MILCKLEKNHWKKTNKVVLKKKTIYLEKFDRKKRVSIYETITFILLAIQYQTQTNRKVFTSRYVKAFAKFACKRARKVGKIDVIFCWFQWRKDDGFFLIKKLFCMFLTRTKFKSCDKLSWRQCRNWYELW